jgi:hypothetical protein
MGKFFAAIVKYLLTHPEVAEVAKGVITEAIDARSKTKAKK